MGINNCSIYNSKGARQRLLQIIRVPVSFPNVDTLGTLTSEEREVVKIINEYKDRSLFKLFSKDKSVKEFQEKISPYNLETFIRPYIERRLFKCFTIARDENIPLFFQKTKAITLHLEDQLSLSEDNAEPVFRFARNEEQSAYNLSVEYAGKSLILKKVRLILYAWFPV